jgi:hypothetical protein
MNFLATTLCELIKQATSNDSENQQLKEDLAEKISLMIDQIPQIQACISDELKKYYDAALPYTEKDIQKNLHTFVERSKIDFSEINCQNKQDNTEIQRRFINWVTMILKADCIDLYRKQRTRVKNNQPAPVNTSLNQKNSQDESGREIIEYIPNSEITIGGLTILIEKEQKEIKSKIIKYIEEDPDDELKNCFPRSRPDCNCQALLKKKLIEGEDNITNIANEFGVPRATLQDFLEYRLNSKRPDAKCLRLLRKEIETKYQINLSEYKDI